MTLTEAHRGVVYTNCQDGYDALTKTKSMAGIDEDTVRVRMMDMCEGVAFFLILVDRHNDQGSMLKVDYL